MYPPPYIEIIEELASVSFVPTLKPTDRKRKSPKKRREKDLLNGQLGPVPRSRPRRWKGGMPSSLRAQSGNTYHSEERDSQSNAITIQFL
jgi:hypothetical protein